MEGPSMTRFQEGKIISTLNSKVSLASLTIASGVFNQLWDSISETKIHFKDQLSGSDLSLHFEEKEVARYNIIVFVAAPITKSYLLKKRELVSSSIISDFDFLRSSRRKSSFSINKAALYLLDSRKDELCQLIARIAESPLSKPYIITGDGISGSVASLFTLWLLYYLDRRIYSLHRRLDKKITHSCVTFGSPLLGYCDILKGTAEYSTWNDLFLHVVSVDDGFPSLFVLPNNPAEGNSMGKTSTYDPFGRFLFCSTSCGAYFEDPKSALVLLRKTSAESWENEQGFDYGSIISSLKNALICKDKTNLNAHGTGSSRGRGRRASLAAQCLAALFQLQDVERISQLDGLLASEVLAPDQKRQSLESKAKDLNDVKVCMAHIEWYKITSDRNKIPYYDSYKNQSVEVNFSVKELKAYLQSYWDHHVKTIGTTTMKQGEALRFRYLFSGKFYQRLVEPLAIADYYRLKDARNYITDGRTEEKLQHYIQLEQGFREAEKELRIENQNVLPPSLTEDSCFWAHVEEAIISCEALIEGDSDSSNIEKLKDFEQYVFYLIKNYKVSSDIFWEKGSFMKWWKAYEKILDKKLMGTSYASPLSDLMRSCRYIEYESGSLFL